MDNKRTIFIPKDKPEYKGFFVSIYSLWSAIEKTELQIERIKSDKKKLNLKILFADIHFFLVAVSGVQKMMLRLKNLLSRNEDYINLYKKHIDQMNLLDSFRDHLEHFDERLDGYTGKGKRKKPLSQPNMLGNLFGDEYDFGGERFNLKIAFESIDKLKTDFAKWNKNNYQFPL